MGAVQQCRGVSLRLQSANGADLRAGISVDQLAARKIGRATRFASLEIGCEGGSSAGNCDHGYSCAYQTNLSWSQLPALLPPSQPISSEAKRVALPILRAAN